MHSEQIAKDGHGGGHWISLLRNCIKIKTSRRNLNILCSYTSSRVLRYNLGKPLSHRSAVAIPLLEPNRRFADYRIVDYKSRFLNCYVDMSLKISIIKNLSCVVH